jgi:hypothetical protein
MMHLALTVMGEPGRTLRNAANGEAISSPNRTGLQRVRPETDANSGGFFGLLRYSPAGRFESRISRAEAMIREITAW